MKNIGLGIVGLGYVGKIHLRNCMKLSNARLVAVSDLSRRALNEARRTGVKKTFKNYERLLKEPDVDAVVISLPTHLHLQCATRAAEAGKHIFLEKPIARNVEEAREIVSTAKHSSVKLMMGYPLRFNRKFRDLREKVKSGLFGDIEVAHAIFISSGPFFHRAEAHAPYPVPEWWFSTERTGGGALIDLGSHMINLMRWYFGEITNLKGLFGHRFNMDFEDNAICLAKFESGTRGVINVGWFSQDYQLKVELYGTAQNASAQNLPGNILLSAAQMLTTGSSNFYWPHLAELQHFVACLIRDSSPSPSGEDGLKDIEAISLAYKNQISLD